MICQAEFTKQKMVYKCVMKAGQEHKHCVGVGIGLVLSSAADIFHISDTEKL